MAQRSPLLCTWLPSKKSMITEFNQNSKATHYLEMKRDTHSTITTIQGEHKDRSRMANIGNNVITNYQY